MKNTFGEFSGPSDWPVPKDRTEIAEQLKSGIIYALRLLPTYITVGGVIFIAHRFLPGRSFEALPWAILLYAMAAIFALICVAGPMSSLIYLFLYTRKLDQLAGNVLKEGGLKLGAQPEPPKCCDFLLYCLLTKAQRATFMDDIYEEYGDVVSNFGKHRADIWYWKQAICSAWPLMSAKTKSWLQGIAMGATAAAEEYVRRHIK